MWIEFLEEWRRKIGEMWKYKFNLFFANLQMFVIFYGLTKYLYQDQKEVLFFSLLIWYFSTHGIMNASYELEDEILDRTLLSILQSKTSILRILHRRNLLLILTDIIKATPLFLLLYFFADMDFRLVVRWYNIIFAVIFAIINSYLLGMALSALVFVFRRITHMISLLYYYILFFGGLTISVSHRIVYGVNRILFPYQSAKALIEMAFKDTAETFLYWEMILQAGFLMILTCLFYRLAITYSLKKGNLYGI